MKVWGPDGSKWRVHRCWSAGRGRPHLGRLWFSPLGLLFIAVELAMVLGNLVTRGFRGHPWPVEARSTDQEKRWLIRGWRESGEVVAFIARTIRASGKPPAYVPGDKTPYD